MRPRKGFLLILSVALAFMMTILTLSTARSWHTPKANLPPEAPAAVTLSVDVSVQQALSPTGIVFAHHPVTAVIQVWNNTTQSLTTTATLTDILPMTAEFVTVTTSYGQCNYASGLGQVVCNLSNLPVPPLGSGGVDAAQVQFILYEEGFYTNTVDLNVPGDISPADNHTDYSFQVYPPQNPSFSRSPDSYTGRGGADILQIDPYGLGIGYPPQIAIRATSLGLTDTDDIDGLSYGLDTYQGIDSPLFFSVISGSVGLTGSDLYDQAHCRLPEVSGDEYVVPYPGTNRLFYDEDGIACSNLQRPGLGFMGTETELDALTHQPPSQVDINGDGKIDKPVYFSLNSGSPSLTSHGWTAADILVAKPASGGITVSRFISGSLLGLGASDNIDAFMLFENGDGVFDPRCDINIYGDVLIFSLDSQSPALTTLGFEAGDLLTLQIDPQGTWKVVRAFPAGLMGLSQTDDVDALKGDAEKLHSWAPFPEKPPRLPQPTGCVGPSAPVGGSPWQSLAPLPLPREGGFATLVGDRIYVGQGLSAFGDDTFTFIYDIPSDTWYQGSPAPVARAELNSTCVEENGRAQVYVVGGRVLNEGIVTNTVMAYDPFSDTWSSRPSMPTPRAGLGLVWVPTNNTLYAIGGRDGPIPHSGTPLSVVEAYDVNAGTWITRSPMPTPMMDIYATVYYSPTNAIYVFGGYDGITTTNIVQVYHVLSDTWTTAAPMSFARSNAVAGLCNGDVYVLGGYDGSNELDANERYDPVADGWTTSVPLPNPRSEFMVSGVSSGDAIYLIGDGINGNAGTAHDRFVCAGASGTGVITGTVYHDRNANRIWDAGEPPLVNWGVQLTYPDGSNYYTLTNADGTFTFNYLPAGLYTITEDIPSPWVQTYPSGTLQGYTVSLTTGQVITGLTFGNHHPDGGPFINSYVFFDANRNLVFDVDEIGLVGWHITVTDPTGTPHILTTTNRMSGRYLYPAEARFAYQMPGVYTVTADLPPGWSHTWPISSTPEVVLNLEDNWSDYYVDFGLYNPISTSIQGAKFLDDNGNGKWDTNENPAAGWDIYLLTPRKEWLAAATTDQSGKFTFLNVPPGNYLVAEPPYTGWVQTLPGAPLFGYTVSVTSSRPISGLLFGNSFTITLTYDLAVTKTANNAQVPAGGEVLYTVQVSNYGAGVARSVRITDTLSQPIFGPVGKAGCTALSSSVVTCLLGDMQPGEVRNIQFSASPQAAGVLTNTVTVTAMGIDQNPQDNTAQVTTTVFAATDMSIRKQASQTTLQSGELVTFTVVVENKGPLTATGVRITDTLPIFLTPVAIPAGCAAGSGTLTCTVGTMAAHTVTTITLPMQASTVHQSLQAINMVEVSSALPDLKTANNFDVVYLTVRPRAIPKPEIYAIDPNQAPNNVTTTVVITGANFQSGLKAYLYRATAGSTALSVQSVSPNVIVAQVPAGLSAGVYDLMVINPDGRSGTLLGAFTAFAPSVPPQLTAVTPNQAPTGQPVLVAVIGQHFVSPVVLTLTHHTQPTRTYHLNVRAFINPNMVIAGVPGSITPGVYDLTVQNPDGLTATLTQAYTATLAVDDLFAYPVDFWVRPRAVRAGQPITLGLLLRRWGGLTALSNVNVAFYLGNPLAGGVRIGTATAATIAPNGRVPVSVTWATGVPSAGRYTLFAVIDPTNAVPETREDNNVITRTLTLLPPAITDAIPPRVLTFTLDGGAMSTLDRQVEISLTASDAGGSGLAFVHYKEFRFDFTTRHWTIAQETGWLPYVPTYTQNYNWRLAPFAGIHYMQAWVMDGAGNISTVPGHAFINYLPHSGGSSPAPPRSPQLEVVSTAPTEAYILQDEVVIFRYRFQAGDSVLVRLTSLEGDADLYVWAPDGSKVGIRETGATVEEVAFTAAQDGVYQIEVAGYTDAAYQLDVLLTKAITPAPPLEVPPPPHRRQRDLPFIDPGDQPEDDVNLPSNPNATSIYLPIVFR